MRYIIRLTQVRFRGNVDTMPDVLKCDIKFKWEDLLNKEGKPYSFPKKRRTVKEELLKKAGIYRWIKTSQKSKNIVCLYIGESGNLYNRLYGYLYMNNKSQATSYRIGRILCEQVGNGSNIRFQTLKLLKSTFAGQDNTNEAFLSMHVR